MSTPDHSDLQYTPEQIALLEESEAYLSRCQACVKLTTTLRSLLLRTREAEEQLATASKMRDEMRASIIDGMSDKSIQRKNMFGKMFDALDRVPDRESIL